MPRTIINLPDNEKDWLDRQARSRHVPMTELVREAVREYRVRHESTARCDLGELLQQTAGLWRHEDGLAWQERLRDEWQDRS